MPSRDVIINNIFSRAIDRYPGQMFSQTLGTGLVSQEVSITENKVLSGENHPEI